MKCKDSQWKDIEYFVTLKILFARRKPSFNIVTLAPSKEKMMLKKPAHFFS